MCFVCVFGREKPIFEGNTKLLENTHPDLIYAVTIEGSMYAMIMKTGKVLWSKEMGEIISISQNSPESIDFRPFLIPNPTDGTLYSLIQNSESVFNLQQMPQSIQLLVSKSPFYSKNGIIQLGSKKDIWHELDPITGEELAKITPTGNDVNREASSSERVRPLIISKTQYSLTLFEHKKHKSIINITFDHYKSNTVELNFDFVFLTSPSGYFAAIKKDISVVVWKIMLDSPVIHVLKMADRHTPGCSVVHVSDRCMSSLVVGFIFHQLHNIGSSSAVVINKQNGFMYTLLYSDPFSRTSVPPISEGIEIINSIEPYIGDDQFLPSICNGLDRSSLSLFSEYMENINQHSLKLINEINAVRSLSDNQTSDSKTTVHFGPIFLTFTLTIVTLTSLETESKTHKIFIDPLNPGFCSIGQGCDGTYIYEGTFDGRSVAVKRVLADSMEIAKQEILTLRESDHHLNVIRYFCTEKDDQFYYIALELCSYNLHEFVTNKNIDKYGLGDKEVLLHATSGLLYLHDLRIIHRDLKPHNILITKPDARGMARALISDFGLCKKLPHGKAALTNHGSSMAGTCGWIAPEVFEGTHPLTFSSDIFSLGCIFFFLLSFGIHPFGDELNRQYNIQSQNLNLTGITDKISTEFLVNLGKNEATDLISRMVGYDPKNRYLGRIIRRPTSKQVLGHLFFWNMKKRSQFLQDFSNYIEDLTNYHPDVLRLEQDSLIVVRGSWTFHIPPPILESMSYHRHYLPSSVRDLIRAIRNKSNHFKESPQSLRDFFGDNPNNLIKYF
ncbi:hypothetical protein MXB_5352, partial [Myxobolus squamalis]